MMIRNANRNISVAKGHGYTLEKVKFAVNFVQKSGRNTTINDWVATTTSRTRTRRHRAVRLARPQSSLLLYATTRDTAI